MTKPLVHQLARAERSVVALAANQHCNYRCKQVWLAIAHDPLRMHPASYRLCAAIFDLRRALRNQILRRHFVEIWRMRHVGNLEGGCIFGTHQALEAACRAVGLQSKGALTITGVVGDIQWLDLPDQALRSLLRQQCALNILIRASHSNFKIIDMEGVTRGVDWWAARSFLYQTHPEPIVNGAFKQAKEWLRKRLLFLDRKLSSEAMRVAWERVVCGSYPTRHRLHSAGLVQCNLCPNVCTIRTAAH